jgi:hypothetical protein
MCSRAQVLRCTVILCLFGGGGLRQHELTHHQLGKQFMAIASEMHAVATTHHNLLTTFTGNGALIFIGFIAQDFTRGQKA